MKRILLPEKFQLGGHEFLLARSLGVDLQQAFHQQVASRLGNQLPFHPDFVLSNPHALHHSAHYALNETFFSDRASPRADFARNSVMETLFMQTKKGFEAVGLVRSYPLLKIGENVDADAPARLIYSLGRKSVSDQGVNLQNIGIGEFLVDRVEQAAREFGEKCLVLSTTPKGKFLYDRLGFILTDSQRMIKLLKLLIPFGILIREFFMDRDPKQNNIAS